MYFVASFAEISNETAFCQITNITLNIVLLKINSIQITTC